MVIATVDSALNITLKTILEYTDRILLAEFRLTTG